MRQEYRLVQSTNPDDGSTELRLYVYVYDGADAMAFTAGADSRVWTSVESAAADLEDALTLAIAVGADVTDATMRFNATQLPIVAA